MGKGMLKRLSSTEIVRRMCLRDLEARGFKECCPWYENRVRILEILGVPRKDVLTISAEGAYDTVSEAESVGRELIALGYQDVIITSSKSHTRRAAFIWRAMFKGRLYICTVAAGTDPYDPGRLVETGQADTMGPVGIRCMGLLLVETGYGSSVNRIYLP